MPNDQHFRILKQGVYTWNRWREDDASLTPDISGADLAGVDLAGAQLRDVNFRKTNLEGGNLRGAFCPKADFWKANLKNADLSNADFILAEFGCADLQHADFSGSSLLKADFLGANLSHANLTGASLDSAHLVDAKLQWADLSNADLENVDLMDADLRHAQLRSTKLWRAHLLRTDLRGAMLSECYVHGASVWKVQVDDDTVQTNLIITDPSEPVATVDNLEVAQFVYLLLNNEKIRRVIDTIGNKGVLILGRFTEERKTVLDAIRTRLRELDFLPMMFDFERSTHRDFTETIKTLAGLSRFIIADITNPKSSPLELQATMPDYMIPFVPIIHETEEPFAMFQDLKHKYGDWVLDVLKYDSKDSLLQVFDKAVVSPALDMSQKLLLRKAEAIRDRHVRDYM